MFRRTVHPIQMVAVIVAVDYQFEEDVAEATEAKMAKEEPTVYAKKNAPQKKIAPLFKLSPRLVQVIFFSFY